MGEDNPIDKLGQPTDVSQGESQKLPREEKTLDPRPLKELIPKQLYSVEALESMFGVTVDQGLIELLQAKTYGQFVANQFQFLGLKEEIDKANRERLRLAEVEAMVSRIPKNLKKVVVNQTYSPGDLALIFGIRIEEGLLGYLEPNLKIQKLPDGNYKVLELTGEAKEQTDIGYNPLVKEVFDALKGKHGDKPFRFYLPDIPLAVRNKIPPGLLPRIYDYFIDAGLVVEEDRPGWYRMVEEYQPPSSTESNS